MELIDHYLLSEGNPVRAGINHQKADTMITISTRENPVTNYQKADAVILDFKTKKGNRAFQPSRTSTVDIMLWGYV